MSALNACNEAQILDGNAAISRECLSVLLSQTKILEADNQAALLTRLIFFLMFSAFNIFLMQVGFAMLEVGKVQTKNAKSVLFKNIIDCCAGVLIWWLWGFGLSTGMYKGFGHYHSTKSWGMEKMVKFFHSFTFSTTCATIISGGVVERMTFPAYMAISVVMTGFIYPTAVSWIWTDNGWLNQLGYTDFAGASLVHGLGGVATLVSCFHLGPRIGRFNFDKETQKWSTQKFPEHSPVFSNLGTFIIFFGFLSFNASSTLGATSKDFEASIRAVANTLLSGASSCVFGTWYTKYRSGVHSLDTMHNCLLIGLVSVAGCCAYVDFYAAPVIGVVAAIIYKACSFTMIHFRIDDPLDAVAVHGAGGTWGVIATGLFLNPAFQEEGNFKGLFYGGGMLLLIQILGSVVVLAWGGILVGLLIYFLKTLSSWKKFPSIRAHKDAEILGLDFAYYDGFMYPDLTKAAIVAHHEKQAAEQRVKAKQKHKEMNLKIVLKRSGSQSTTPTQKTTSIWTNDSPSDFTAGMPADLSSLDRSTTHSFSTEKPSMKGFFHDESKDSHNSTHNLLDDCGNTYADSATVESV